MGKVFSKNDIEIIKKYYEEFGYKKCMEYIPNVTPIQIMSKAKYYKLKYKNAHTGKISISNFESMTNEVVYCLGFIWGDGYISKSNNQIKFHIKTCDSEYLLYIINKIGKWNLYQYPDGKSVEITCVDYKLHKWFCQYDFQEKSYIEPTKILSIIPKEKHYLFWLGLIDADGSFYIDKRNNHLRFELASTYEYLYSEFSFFLDYYKIFYKIRKRIKNTGKSSNIIICRQEDIYKLGKSIYKTDIGFPRKRKIWENHYQSILDSE